MSPRNVITAYSRHRGVINYENVARHRNPINVASRKVLVSEAQCKKRKKKEKNGIENA